MKKIASLAGPIIAKNYLQGALIAHFLNEKTKKIYLLNGKFFEYKNQENTLFIEKKIPEEENTNNITIINEEVSYEVEQIVLNDLFEVLKVIENYSYVCIDEDFLNIIENISLNYIKEEKFSSTFEGYVWSLVLKLFEPPYSSDFFDKIEQLKNTNINKQNCFPYIQYSYLKNEELLKEIEKLVAQKNLQKLFLFISNKVPEFFKENDLLKLKDFLTSGVCLKKFIKKDQSKFLIDKSLAKYFENVLYIGKEPLIGVSVQLIYNPRFVQHTKWDVINVDLKVNSTYEEKLFNNNEFAKLAINKLKLKVDQKNIYSYIKKMALNNIKGKLLNKNINEDWKQFLSFSGFEYIKILNKANQFINNFFSWHDDNYLTNPVFEFLIDDFCVDFVAKKDEKFFVAIFAWNMPVLQNIKFYQPKIEKIIKYYNNDLAQIAVISSSKVSFVKIDALSESSIKNYKKTQESDFFYWNDVIFEK